MKVDANYSTMSSYLDFANLGCYEDFMMTVSSSRDMWDFATIYFNTTAHYGDP